MIVASPPVPELPSEEQAARLDRALASGCSVDEAAAHVGVSRATMTAYVAKRSSENPDWLAELNRADLRRSAAAKIYDAKVVERMADLAETQLELATGDDPQLPAIRDMLDRVRGKATERLDVTSKGEKLNSYTPEELARIEAIFGRGDDGGRA